MAVPAAYAVRLHEEVAADLAVMQRNVAAKIVRAMEQRLSGAPQQYGDRLRKSFHGFWKLRIGDYRVVFELVGRQVRVYGVMHRASVYERIAGRLARGWIARKPEGPS